MAGEWLGLFLERRHPVDVSVRAVALEAVLSRISSLPTSSLNTSTGQFAASSVAASLMRIVGHTRAEETYSPENERWDEKAYLLALVQRACAHDAAASEICAKAFAKIGAAALNYAVLPGDTHSGVFLNTLASSDWLLLHPASDTHHQFHLSLPFELHYQGLDGGLTKRSRVDVRLATGPDTALSPAFPLLSLALAADGLGALLGDGADSGGDSGIAEQEASGGMALAVLGARLRPYNFFRFGSRRASLWNQKST